MSEILVKRYEEYINKHLSEQLRNASNLKEMNDIMSLYMAPDQEKEEFAKRRELVCAIFDQYSMSDKDILRYHSILYHLYTFKDQMVVRFAEATRIIVPNKIRKKGKTATVNKIMSKFHVPKVAHALVSTYLMYMKDSFPEIFDTNLGSSERLKKLRGIFESDDASSLKYHTKKIMFYSILRSSGNDDLADIILGEFDEETWWELEGVFADTYTSMRHNEFVEKGQNAKTKVMQLKQQNKSLSMKMSKQQKMQSQLQVELHEKAQKEKELKGAIHELNGQLQHQLNDALHEIQNLETKIQDQQAQHKEETYAQENKILELERIIAENDYVRHEYKPLRDKVICVVGSPKKREEYKETIEKYGGKFEFYPSVPDAGLSGMAGPVKRSDIVMYLTTYTNHTVLNKLHTLKEGDRIKYLNAGGSNYFENQVILQVIPVFEKINVGGTSDVVQ